MRLAIRERLGVSTFIAAVALQRAVIAGNDYNEALEDDAMGTLTIRNLEDPLKSRLRMRAAARNRSMEEEARQILRAALKEPPVQEVDLGTRIRARFAALGDIQLSTEPRQATREPPELDAPRRAGAVKRKASTPRR